MNREEAARVIATITAPYGGEPLGADAIEAWFMSALERCDFDEGMAIAQLLIGSEEFRPTPAVFNREVRIRRQHGAIAGASAHLELAPAPPDSADAVKVRQIIDDLRVVLARKGPRKHWHDGPDPCPVCGGMNTTPSKRRQREQIETHWCSRCGSNSMPHTMAVGLSPGPMEPPLPYKGPGMVVPPRPFKNRTTP